MTQEISLKEHLARARAANEARIIRDAGAVTPQEKAAAIHAHYSAKVNKRWQRRGRTGQKEARPTTAKK